MSLSRGEDVLYIGLFRGICRICVYVPFICVKIGLVFSVVYGHYKATDETGEGSQSEGGESRTGLISCFFLESLPRPKYSCGAACIYNIIVDSIVVKNDK